MLCIALLAAAISVLRQKFARRAPLRSWPVLSLSDNKPFTSLIPASSVRRYSCLAMILSASLSASTPPLFAAEVAFDVNAFAPAHPVSVPLPTILSPSDRRESTRRITDLPGLQAVVDATGALPDSYLSTMLGPRHVEVALNTSTLVPSGFRGRLIECQYRMVSHARDWPVIDYAPQTTMMSNLEGDISVAENKSRNRHAGIYAVGGYPGIAAKGNATYDSDVNRERRYTELAPKQLVAAAGPIERGMGVYFKLCRNNQESLEGARTFRIVFEVPAGWRGGLIDVQMQAFGTEDADSKHVRLLGESRYLVAVYDPLDSEAQQAAAQFAQNDLKLRQSAISYAPTIRHRSAPTPIHKIGIAMDLMEPEIPENWLNDFIFGPTSQYPIGDHSRLPVNVRVAILNYLDSKKRMEQADFRGQASGTRLQASGTRLQASGTRLQASGE